MLRVRKAERNSDSRLLAITIAAPDLLILHQLFPQNGYFVGSCNAYAYLVALHAQHSDSDVLAAASCMRYWIYLYRWIRLDGV